MKMRKKKIKTKQEQCMCMCVCVFLILMSLLIVFLGKFGLNSLKSKKTYKETIKFHLFSQNKTLINSLEIIFGKEIIINFFLCV